MEKEPKIPSDEPKPKQGMNKTLLGMLQAAVGIFLVIVGWTVKDAISALEKSKETAASTEKRSGDVRNSKSPLKPAAGSETRGRAQSNACATAGGSPAVNYQVLKAVRKAPHKLRMDIMLDRKLSEDEILQLACSLKAEEREIYEIYYFFFFVEGINQDRSAGAWAICHFNPFGLGDPLELKILGFGKGDETLPKWSSKDGKLIGMWVFETGLPSVRILFEKEGRYILESRYKQGTVIADEVTWDGQRIEEKGGNRHGEYYQVLPENRLGIFGENGLFATGEPVEPEAEE